MMLARYFDKGVAPKGVLKPTFVLAMNGTTLAAIPMSVRPINTAVPYVVAHGIPPSKFIRHFTQQEAQTVADYVLEHGAGETLLFVWQHWDALDVINTLGVPVPGWNNRNLSQPTQNVYPPVVVLTPGKEGVTTRLYNTPDIGEDLMPRWVNGVAPSTVWWQSFTPWKQVAAQQGHLSPLDKEEER